ncbi:MAG: dephospho-CoA kinase [Elusimicrobiota bacterium]
MRKRFVVGLTGGLASGKSLALETFRRAGAVAISLDAVSRDLCRPGTKVLARVARAFGRGILRPDGALDRAALGDLVFADKAERRRLEAVLHPAIRAEMRRRIFRARGLVVVEVPLLFETGGRGLGRSFDTTMLVTAPKAARLARARAAGLTSAQARARMAAQLPDRVKAARADVVVVNAGSREDFVRRIREYGRAFRLIQAAGRLP